MRGSAILLALLCSGCGLGEGFAGGPFLFNYFAYAVNKDSNNLSILKMNSATGALSSVGTQAVGTSPKAVAADPQGRFVYVANGGAASISVFSLDPLAGTLTLVETHAVMTGPSSLVAHASGKFLYVVGSTELRAYAVGETGALTQVGASVTVGSLANQVLLDPAGTRLYVVEWVPESVVYFSINQDSGALTSLGAAATLPTGQYSNAMTFDPLGKFAFILYSVGTTGSVEVFSVGGTGTLTDTGLALATPAGTLDNGSAATNGDPSSLVVDPTGAFLYVSNFYSDSVTVARIGSTGALTKVADKAGFVRPNSVVFEPSGRFLFVANAAGNSVFGYSPDSAGGLTRAGLGGGDTNTVAVAVAKIQLSR